MTTPARPSTSIAFRIADAVGGGLYRLIGGAILFVPGGFLLLRELNHNYSCDEQLRTAPLAIAVGLMLCGALVVTPSLGPAISSIVVTVAPYVPWIGGKRAGDPPAGSAPQSVVTTAVVAPTEPPAGGKP